MSTFYIESGTGQKITDPSQADPSKTYVESGTGRQLLGSQLMPSLSGTGTPLPGGTPSLPSGSNQPGNLTSYADSVTAVMNLAREHRNALSMDFMKPFSGVVPASDFNSILGNFNSASEKTMSDQLKTQTPDIVTATNDNGDVTGINKLTGEVLWTNKGVGNKQTGGSSGGTLAERQAASISKFSSAFVPGAHLPSGIPVLDVEGKLTPEAWNAAIADAPAEGLTREQFLQQFGYLIVDSNGEVSYKYGLTPAEVKIVGATKVKDLAS